MSDQCIIVIKLYYYRLPISTHRAKKKKIIIIMMCITHVNLVKK